MDCGYRVGEYLEPPKVDKKEKDQYELEIGDIVSTTFNEIYSFYIIGAELYLIPLVDEGEYLSQKVTLLRYEGRGIFTEMYTGQKISMMKKLKKHFKKDGYKIVIDKGTENYKLSPGEDTSKNVLNSCTLDDYIYFKEHLILLKKFYRIEDKTYQKIGDQDKEKEQIKMNFDSTIEERSLNIEKSLNEIYTQIMDEAYGENIAYNFKHNINPPMLVLENKKSDEEN